MFFKKLIDTVINAFKTYSWLKFVCAGVAAIAIAVPVIVVVTNPGDNPNASLGDGGSQQGGGEQTPPSDEELIESTINKFLTSYNSGDMEAAMDCLDAKTRNAFQAMLNLLGGIAGSITGVNINLSDLFSLGVGIVQGDFMKLEITHITVSDSKSAVATTKMFLTGAGTHIIYFEMVYENDAWCISDISDNKPDMPTDNTTSNLYTEISTSAITDFESGIAEVNFTLDGVQYLGIVNSKGEVFYYCESSKNEYWRSVGRGCGYVCTYDNKWNVDGVKIINSEGTVVATSKDGLFDEVYGYGDGLVFVYKNTSTMTKEEHSYGVIDASTGDWKYELKPYAKLPSTGYGYDMYSHAGDGVFYICASYNSSCTIYNAEINKGFYLSIQYYYGRVTKISVDNTLCFKSIDDRSTIRDFDDNSTKREVPEHFCVDARGNVTEIEPCLQVYKNLRYCEGEHPTIYNSDTKASYEYTEVTTDMIKRVELFESGALVVIQGADRKLYFTVINSEAQPLFTPIITANSDICASEGKIVYETSNGNYAVVDTNGKILISEDAGFTYISDFSDGIAKATKDGEEMLIDSCGNKITIKLKK